MCEPLCRGRCSKTCWRHVEALKLGADNWARTEPQSQHKFTAGPLDVGSKSEHNCSQTDKHNCSQTDKHPDIVSIANRRSRSVHELAASRVLQVFLLEFLTDLSGPLSRVDSTSLLKQAGLQDRGGFAGDAGVCARQQWDCLSAIRLSTSG